MGEDLALPPEQPVRTPLKTWGPVALVAAIILALSSIPGTTLPQHPDWYNSAAHFLEFGIFGFVLSRALMSGRQSAKLKLVLNCTMICGIFAFLDEAHQFLIPYRVFDFMDLVFDLAGSLTGTALYMVVGKPPGFKRGV